MPVITVNVPEASSDPLVKQLSSQFARLQASLSKRPSSAGPDLAPVLKQLSKQQDALVKALTNLAGKSQPASRDAALVEALKGLKKLLSSLPDTLSGALETRYRKLPTSPRPSVTVRPEVHVNLTGVTKSLNRLEDALTKPKGFRNRTFGSTF